MDSTHEPKPNGTVAPAASGENPQNVSLEKLAEQIRDLHEEVLQSCRTGVGHARKAGLKFKLSTDGVHIVLKN
jgi:hypothetical protein